MKSKVRHLMKLTFEIIAGLLGILLASWSGPAIHDYIDPKIKIICPVCAWGPNEPRKE